MVNTAFALKFTLPFKLEPPLLLISPQFALFWTIFTPSKFVQIQFFVQCGVLQSIVNCFFKDAFRRFFVNVYCIAAFSM